MLFVIASFIFGLLLGGLLATFWWQPKIPEPRPTISPTTSILVLAPNNLPAVLISQTTLVRSDVDIVSPDIRGSCSLSWRGNFYLFGGSISLIDETDDQRHRILKLDGCQFSEVGLLSFPFESGACANVNDLSIFLCFDDSNNSSAKSCQTAHYPTGRFEETESSVYAHRQQRIGASQGNL